MNLEYEIPTGRNLFSQALIHTVRTPDRIIGILLLILCYILESFYRIKLGVVEGDLGLIWGVPVGGFFSYFGTVILLSRLVERVHVNYLLIRSIKSVSGDKLTRVFEIEESGIKIIEEKLVEAHYAWASMTKPKKIGRYVMMSTMHRDIAFVASHVDLSDLIQKWERGTGSNAGRGQAKKS